MNKKTLVLGASPHSYRYSNKVFKSLLERGYEVVPIGNREKEICGHKIMVNMPDLNNIHTVTIYLNPLKQPPYYDYLLKLNPSRIIFNPGAENPELSSLALKNGIEVNNACTLVMLSQRIY